MLEATIQRVLAIAAPLAVTLGVIIAILQLRNQTRLRQLEIVMRLYSSFGQEDFVRHYNRLSSWKFKTYAQYRKKATREDAAALFVVGVFFENMGLLLKRGLAPIALLDDLLSGPILQTWPILSPIALGLRQTQNHAAWFEWFEYLHNQMAARVARLDKPPRPRSSGRA